MDKVTELARRLEPFTLRMIRDVIGAQNATGTGGSQFNILLYDTSATKIRSFSATAAGLTAALAAAASGDVVWLPAGTIPGDHTIAVPVVGASRTRSILSGKITIAANGVLSNLSVIRTANDANDLIGVESAAECYIYNCNVSCVQSGAGNVYGVKAITGGNISILDSWLSGHSTGGSGYSVFSSGGDIHVYGGIMEYSTAAAEVAMLEYYDFIDTKGGWYFVSGTWVGYASGDWVPGSPGTLTIYATASEWQSGGWWLDGQGTIAHTDATFTIEGTFTPSNQFAAAYILFTDATKQQIDLDAGERVITVLASNDGKTVNRFAVETQVYGSPLRCIIDNIWIDGFTLPAGDIEVHAVQMDAVTGTPLAGDRAAWDATDYGSLHAKDIADVALQRHLPLPGILGQIAYSDGTDWQLGDVANIGNIAAMEGPGIDIVTWIIGLGGDTILLYYADGSPVAEFAATEAGFAAALAAGDANDVRVLPIVTIPGNHTIAVPVLGISNAKSILSGKITMAAGGILNNLAIIRTANDADDLIGIESAAECYIGRCNISCIQSGVGNVYSVKSDAGGIIHLTSNRIVGQSIGGDGYSAYVAGGDIYAYSGRMEYSTAATLGDVGVFAVQMDAISGVPLAGDRGAWNATDYGSLHAKDIADAALQRHLPLPGAAGRIAYSDGTDWQSGKINNIAGTTVMDWMF